MKKITTLLTAVLIIAASVSFANDTTPVPDRIAKALTLDFEKPSNIEWKTTDAFYKASFTTNAQALEAFYNAAGELIATSRKVSVDQLPMSLQKDLKQKAPIYHEEELFELLTDRGTEYFVRFNNGSTAKSYKSMGGSWVRI